MNYKFSKALLLLIIAINCIACNTIKSDNIYAPQFGDGRYILTPKEKSEPAINGPSVFGIRPGSPFLYTVPVSGDRPIKYSAKELPAGLTIDPNSGKVTGKIIDLVEKEYTVQFIAENNIGVAKKDFTIKVGDEICLTPPLGWNSWNCWKKEVTQNRVLASAKAMVDKGLIKYGWTYINIDDAWQGKRGGKHNGIQSNPVTFPDMKKMCDSIHALGLKTGIYSTPWISSYAGFIGGSSNHRNGMWKDEMGTQEARKSGKYWVVGDYHFDTNDAAQWADWGIDYLKYDWYLNDAKSTRRMANALKNCGRDIVYSLSNSAEIGKAHVYAETANCFRTAGDLKDRWDQDGYHLNIREQWVLHRTWMEVGFEGGPGHFPDPDMLVIGDVVTSSTDGDLRPSSLTPDEQYSHVSLWALWAAPMLIGAPIETMDDFTLNLLTNSAVLEIHQDEKAIPAKSVSRENDYEIFVKELYDGSIAVGLFNTSSEEKIISFNWELADLRGEKEITDLWRQTKIGTYNNNFSAKVPSHGVVLISVK